MEPWTGRVGWIPVRVIDEWIPERVKCDPEAGKMYSLNELRIKWIPKREIFQKLKILKLEN